MALPLSVCEDAVIRLPFTLSSPGMILVSRCWDKHYPVETQRKAEEGSFCSIWGSREASNRLMQSTRGGFFFGLEVIWCLCLYWSLCHAKICALWYFWQHILLVPFLSSFCKHGCNFCQTVYLFLLFFFVLLLNLQAATCWFPRAEVRKRRIIEPVRCSCVVLLRGSEPLLWWLQAFWMLGAHSAMSPCPISR